MLSVDPLQQNKRTNRKKDKKQTDDNVNLLLELINLLYKSIQIISLSQEYIYKQTNQINA